MVDSALELAQDHLRRPAWRAFPRPAQLGSIPGDLDLYYDDVYSLSDGRAHRLRPPGGAGRAGVRSAHLELRRRHLRRRHRAQGAGQLAWLRGRVPALLLLGFGRAHRAATSRATCSAITGTRWRARWRKLESAESVGRTAAQRTLRRLGARKVKTARVPIVFDPAGGPRAAGSHLRRRQRRQHLSSRLVPGGQAGREDRGGKRDRDRRRHHRRRLRHAVRSTAKACPRGAPR